MQCPLQSTVCLFQLSNALQVYLAAFRLMAVHKLIASIRIQASDLISQLMDLFAHLLGLVFVHSEEDDVLLLRWPCFVAKVILEGLPVANRVGFICCSTLLIRGL